MIQRLRRFFSTINAEEKIEPTVEVDINNIYVRLKVAIDRVGSSSIHLNARPTALGNIESFTETLVDMHKSLMEVNQTLEESKHVENGIFYIKKARTVKFDRFLFVKDGFYVDDAPATLQKVLEQIDRYYEQMKDADKVPYGVREHNHRQLYSYTETLIQFLNQIFEHFGE